MIEKKGVQTVELDKQENETQASTMSIESNKLDKLLNLSGELVTVRAQYARLINLFNESVSGQKRMSDAILGIKGQYENLVGEFNRNFSQGSNTKAEEFKKFKSDMDELNEKLNELQAFNLKTSLAERILFLDETTSSLGKISSDIQSGVMETRMIPIEGVFSEFKGVVQVIAKDLKKEIDLVIEGEDTELDKKMIDSLTKPLTHMIRNACDSAIEDPEERLALGKTVGGTITLNAFHKGNSICIEVRDDGRGIDADEVANIALSNGLITEEQMETLEEKDKLNLLFDPGFSNHAKEKSSMNLGMDAVTDMMSEVNGTIDIETEVGVGTTFTVKIPLTLAIIQAFLAVVGKETYALPLDAVTEIIKVNEEDIYFIDGNRTVKLRNHTLSLVELEKVIGIDGSDRESNKQHRIVVISDGNTQLGVMVDSLIGEEEVVVKPLSHHFERVKGVVGASILGDGTVALILDPAAIIHQSC